MLRYSTLWTASFFGNECLWLTLCQSSVVCVMCSRLMFPYLVCFLSSFNVIISWFCSSCVCLINVCILVPACSVSCRLVYSLLPGDSVSLPSLVLPCLVIIKDYYFEFTPRLRVPCSSRCVHRDRRPDLTVSGAHSPCFVFCFLKVFCSCLSVPQQGSRRS